jgi:alkanesulfonate monooxygenase
MSVEFIGMIGTQAASEIHPPRGPVIDIDYVRRFAQAHEQAGFDRILIGYFSNGADGFVVTSYAAFVTSRLQFMLAHRPGFVAPTLAARKLATLDQFSGGRLAVHIISGGDDNDQARDGDSLPHDERYARTDEYVEILRQVWTADTSPSTTRASTIASGAPRPT